MPVSVVTDIITWVEMGMQILQMSAEFGVLVYLVFGGGWLDMIRLISFWVDGLVIKYTDRFYKYFTIILDGNIINPETTSNIMKNVFLFVAVIALIKLGMVLIRYLINPSMVEDEKLGGGVLVKRIIIGMCLIIAINPIFSLSRTLQSAILKDNLIARIFLSTEQVATYEENQNEMGRLLAFNVYSAFWSLNRDVSNPSLINEYKMVLAQHDPTVIDDINADSNGDYAYDYFPIASTVLLCYVLYLIIKYCIDLVVRSFKLLIMQVLAPLAITDYMVKGKDGMMGPWLKTTLSCYALLFMRVVCIWFVAFVTSEMVVECGAQTGISCDNSLLYVPAGGTPDYLLRGVITIGLLAFLMDLPKTLSEILGLDLEQDASVKGLMGKIGGVGKMVGMGALAVGGGVVGGAMSTLKGGASTAKNAVLDKAVAKEKLSNTKNKNQKAFDSKIADIDKRKAAGTISDSDAAAEKSKASAEKTAADKQAEESYKKSNKANTYKAISSGVGNVSGLSGTLTGAVFGNIPLVSNMTQGYDKAMGTAKAKENETKQNYADSQRAKSEMKEYETQQDEQLYRERNINVLEQVNLNTQAQIAATETARTDIKDAIGATNSTLGETLNTVKNIDANTETVVNNTNTITTNTETIANNTETIAKNTAKPEGDSGGSGA